MTAIPKNAAAIILLQDRQDPKVFWVKRGAKLMFMPGFHAFPGGQVDAGDVEVSIQNAEDEESAVMRVAAVREFFEETGVLLAKGAERLSPEDRKAERLALEEGAKTFKQILEDNQLTIDAADLLAAGRWVTPPMSPRRFDTCFYLAWLTDNQEPQITHGELAEGEWIRPQDAFERFQRGETLMASPTLYILRTLATNVEQPQTLQAALTAIPDANRGKIQRIEFK